MNAQNRVSQYDCILVGGGLQSGLLALAIKRFHPDARVLMIERQSQIAGNHTWSFHPGDVPPSARGWVGPLVQHRWDGYEIRLGRFGRHVGLEYASISSDHFRKLVSQLFGEYGASQSQSLHRVVELAVAGGVPGSTKNKASVSNPERELVDSDSDWHLLTHTDVVSITDEEVVTSCGRTFRGELVIDCRGPSQSSQNSGRGYQKFVGFELELVHDWPDKHPVVMESLDDQRDGFRFLYTLPFDTRRVLVEDTRFSDTPDLDRDECLDLVTRYVNQKGSAVFSIVREESGVLPMPFASEHGTGSCEASGGQPLRGGYAGGWFHCATGYSFPMAVAFANAVASGPFETAKDRVHDLSTQHRWRVVYSRFLNRLLFRLVAPTQRHQIFRRFYRILEDSAVERFYSHRFNPLDAFRIIVGVPPTIIGLRPLRFVRSFFSGANS